MRVRARPDHPSLFDYFDRVEARVAAQSAALEHERKAGRSGPRPERWTLDRGRVSEIQQLIRLRHGGPCDTDDGALYLQAALPHLMRLHAGPALVGKVLAWARTWAPGLDPEAVALALDVGDASAVSLLSADALAGLLGVTRQERADLRMRTIGATDFCRRQRLAERRHKDAAYQAKRRKAAGATPREGSNVAKAKALGISLSTYKRRLKQAPEPAHIQVPEPISSAIVRSTYTSRRDRVTVSEQTAPGPASESSLRHIVGADGHSPSGRVRAIRGGHAVALPLPADGVSEHPDMLGGGEWKQLGAVLTDYDGGVLPEDLVRSVRDAQRVRQMTQQALADQIGISRPQLANVLQRRFGLSQSAAANLRGWLAA